MIWAGVSATLTITARNSRAWLLPRRHDRDRRPRYPAQFLAVQPAARPGAGVVSSCRRHPLVQRRRMICLGLQRIFSEGQETQRIEDDDER